MYSIYFCLIKLALVEDRFDVLRGEIAGPPDTPYEGGTFSLGINLPSNYPFAPPAIRFLTKIWHPNVSSVTGVICLDVLTQRRWKASMSLKAAMLSLQILLQNAAPDNPLDGVVAEQYIERPQMFRETAKYWTSVYAGGPCAIPTEYEEKVKTLIGMGVEEDKTRKLLSSNGWDVQRSADYLD